MLPFLFAATGASDKKVTSESWKYFEKRERIKDFLGATLIHVSRRIS